MSSRGFLGAGDVYISRYDPNTATFLDYEGPIECGKFEIKPNSDLKEQTSRGKNTYGQITESVPIPKPSELSIEFTQVDRTTLETALFGTTAEVNIGAGTVTDESVTMKVGKWAQLAHGNLATAGLVVTNSAATTTYVLGTHYEINYRLGMIRAIGSTIADGDVVKIDYAHNAVTGSKISGSKQSQVRAKFKLDGINFADQLPVITEVHEAVLTPESAFDFLGNDFAKISLKGRMKTPTGKTEPFTVTLLDSAA